MGYRVEVEDRGLHKALSLPEVTVGGTSATDPEFSRDGTSLRGRVGASPPNTEFVIDYGFARAEVLSRNGRPGGTGFVRACSGAGAYSTA
jgi:hypothetical protein